MSFPFLRLAALAALGWIFYRSCGPRGQQDEKPPDAGAETPDAPGGASAEPDDLTRISGIGPAIARLLGAAGITTWAQLAATEVAALQAILDQAGPRFRIHDPSRWPGRAAELASAN